MLFRQLRGATSTPGREPRTGKPAKADVLQADWDRTNIGRSMIVTKKYRGTPNPTCHTGDTHNKSLNKLLSDHPRTWWYAHRT
ncbi:hypothetical protein ACIRP3_00360 [Streptomyces sp. NPDC101209]|uniref:hypothetical protein n=1 Tax=Streptomyces sp. NPDC101209 TaxID=3366129 RepID=UPI00382A1E8B